MSEREGMAWYGMPDQQAAERVASEFFERLDDATVYVCRRLSSGEDNQSVWSVCVVTPPPRRPSGE